MDEACGLRSAWRRCARDGCRGSSTAAWGAGSVATSGVPPLPRGLLRQGASPGCSGVAAQSALSGRRFGWGSLLLPYRPPLQPESREVDAAGDKFRWGIAGSGKGRLLVLGQASTPVSCTPRPRSLWSPASSGAPCQTGFPNPGGQTEETQPCPQKWADF